MILADKIINERKKNGWSQEELAEKLSVSRQSVSKWEGAQSIPDLKKIILMSKLFGVSTDYLLKDDIETVTSEYTLDMEQTADESEDVLKYVSMEEANNYIEVSNKEMPKIANAVSMCIICPVVLIFLTGLSEYNMAITEGMAMTIGIIVLFSMIAGAVFTFIKSGNRLEQYEYIGKEAIDTEYGVTGMVRDLLNKSKERRNTLTGIGVVLCIVGLLPLIIAGVNDASEFVCVCMTCLLLIIISVGVNIFVRLGTEHDVYMGLLQEGEYSIKNKKERVKNSLFDRIYWLSITVAFLIAGFVYGNWKYTGLIWPIAGVMYGIFRATLKLRGRGNP